MNRTRLTAATGIVALLALAGPALAADGDGGTAAVTATVVGGERSVTSVLPIALAATSSTNVLSGSVAVVVDEVDRAGTNAWSVTASSSAMSSGSDSIPASALSLTDRTVVQTLGGGTAAGVSGAGSLGTAQTLFSVSGQSTSTAYTGSYAGAATLTLEVPVGTPSGAYAGTLTVTLVQ